MINDTGRPLDKDIQEAIDRCADSGIKLTVTLDERYDTIIFRYRKGHYGLTDLIHPFELDFAKTKAKEVISLHVSECIKRINKVTKGE